MRKWLKNILLYFSFFIAIAALFQLLLIGIVDYDLINAIFHDMTWNRIISALVAIILGYYLFVSIGPASRSK